MFRPALIKRRIKLKAAEVGANVRAVLEDRARALLEGVCGKEGFVRPGTVALEQLSPGVLSTIDMGRHYEFALVLRAEVCNPAPGLQFTALVRETNNFGVLAEGGYYDEKGTLVPVIEVVVVRDTVVAKNEVDLSKVKPGDEIGIELLGKRYELRDKRISAFGRAVAQVKLVAGGADAVPLGESTPGGGERSGADPDEPIIGDSEDTEDDEEKDEEEDDDTEDEEEDEEDTEVDTSDGDESSGGEFAESEVDTETDHEPL